MVSVNDDVILESDITKFREKAKSKSFQELFGGIDPKFFADRNTAISLLVDEKIIDQWVKKLDLQSFRSGSRRANPLHSQAQWYYRCLSCATA